MKCPKCHSDNPSVSEFWKDADPSIAEVEDAKKRLMGLKRE
jgi:hypothetical protein